MNLGLIKGIVAFVVLLLVQALVLNRIHLFNCATPLLYVYVAMLFRRNFPRWAILVSCFTMGLCVDIFSNTPGVAAGAMTLIGLLQPYSCPVKALMTCHQACRRLASASSSSTPSSSHSSTARPSLPSKPLSSATGCIGSNAWAAASPSPACCSSPSSISDIASNPCPTSLRGPSRSRRGRKHTPHIII